VPGASGRSRSYVVHRVRRDRSGSPLALSTIMLTSHRLLGLVFAISVGFGCGTNATIESTWRAPSAPELTNVVTLSPASDPGLRHSAEDKLAQQLTSHGVRAVPGYTVLRDQDLADRTRIAAELSARGFDGVVAMRLVSANQQLAYYPTFDDYWGGAWGTSWGANAVPETVVKIEVNAYSLATKQLVFSAMSKSVDPGSANDAIAAVSKIATEKLAEARVVGPTQATMNP